MDYIHPGSTNGGCKVISPKAGMHFTPRRVNLQRAGEGPPERLDTGIAIDQVSKTSTQA
jgi:hypothetical protein